LCGSSKDEIYGQVSVATKQTPSSYVETVTVVHQQISWQGNCLTVSITRDGDRCVVGGYRTLSSVVVDAHAALPIATIRQLPVAVLLLVTFTAREVVRSSVVLAPDIGTMEVLEYVSPPPLF
jgi:hypothetical protein